MLKVYGFSDLARTMMAQTRSAELKSEQTQLSVELSTGQTSNPIQHLRADVTVLQDATRQKALAERFLQTNTETEHFLDTAQASLASIKGEISKFQDMLSITPHSDLAYLAMEADAVFSTVVNALNVSAAGRHAFSGQNTNQAALLPPADFHALVETALSGATTVTEIQANLDAFFEPGGTFETSVYQGSETSLTTVQTSEKSELTLSVRADDQAFRDVLKATLMISAAQNVSGLSRDAQNTLVSEAQSLTLSANGGVITLAGHVGFLQEQTENATVKAKAQIAASDLIRSELLSVDPYDTASRLEDVNTQLELLYAATARARNLSFLEFMR